MKLANVLLRKCSEFLAEASRLSKRAMIVHGDPSENCFVVADGAHIWLFSDKSRYADEVGDMDEPDAALFEDMLSRLKLPENKANSSPSDAFDYLMDSRPDVLMAYYSPGKAALDLGHSGSFRLSPRSSLLIKKVVKQLGIQDIDHADSTSEDMENVRHRFYEAKGDVPNVLYHGTSLQAAIGICRTGLAPRPESTNYKFITHDKYVFLTSLFDEAKHHAHVAAQNKKDTENKGIVISFRVPDKSRLVADWDIDTESTETTFKRPEKKFEKSLPQKDSLRLSREFGLWGYEGRIPPSFINKITFLDSENQSHEVDVDDLCKIRDRGGSYEYLYWEDEEDLESDED